MNAQGFASDQGAPIRCPFCNAEDTEPMSMFGQQLLTVQYYCRACRTPFEKVKDERTLRDFGGDAPNEPGAAGPVDRREE